MPEPLKNLYSQALVESLATQLKSQYVHFDTAGFIQHVLDEEWHTKELKGRMRHISESMLSESRIKQKIATQDKNSLAVTSG